jgi:hypothetical protein
MTSSCPQCGTHLSIVRAQDASDTTTDTVPPAPQQRDSEQPSDADPGSSNLSSSKDSLELDKNDDLEPRRHHSDLARLATLICMCVSYESGGFTTYPRYLSFRQSLDRGHVGVV